MIIDHVGGEASWLYVLTGGNNFIVSAAEGFMLLSGLSMGIVHRTTITRGGLSAMVAKVFGRVRILYATTVVLTIAFASLSFAFSTPWSYDASPAHSRADFVLSVLTLHRTYSLTDILVLYTLLVLTAGPVLALLARGYTGAVLAMSVTAWVVFQIWPEQIPRFWAITDGGFPFSAWQMLFVVGLVLGYHRAALERYFAPARLLAFSAGCAAAIVVVAGLHLDTVALSFGTGADPSLGESVLSAKNDFRIGRVAGLFAVAPALYAIVTLAWMPVRRLLGWLLLVMGQRALFAYGVQLFVVAFMASGFFAPVRIDRENALFQATAVLAVWVACLWQPAALAFLGRFRARLHGPATAVSA